MEIKLSSLISSVQILTVQSPTVRKCLMTKGFRSMAMTGPMWQLNLNASLLTGFATFRLTLITIPFIVPARNLCPIVGSYCSLVIPIARTISARRGSSRSITSSSIGCLIFLISHHLIVPSVDAEKNSVLVLDWIQSVWFVGFLSRIVGGNGRRNGSDGDYNLAAKRQALWKHFATTTTAEIATAFMKRMKCIRKLYPLWIILRFRSLYRLIGVFWIINAEVKFCKRLCGRNFWT